MISGHSEVPPKRERQSSFKNHWIILLIEFVNLLGLFLSHARHAKSAQATTALFEQLVRHLTILSKLPDHDGAMIIRQVLERDHIALKFPHYLVIFGNIILRGDRTGLNTDAHPERLFHFASALRQAFGCLSETGVHAFYLQLPGKSSEEVDRLRLALNIVARFGVPNANSNAITFRYFDRSLTIPLIRDQHGQADPNLTLLAGLNGLSAANTIELIKQAEAYGKINPNLEDNPGPVNWYNRIIGEPHLRRHLHRPPVEINNLPWADPNARGDSREIAGHEAGGRQLIDYQQQTIRTSSIDRDRIGESEKLFFRMASKPDRIALDRAVLLSKIKAYDPHTMAVIDKLLNEDYPVLNVVQFARRLVDISQIIDAMEHQSIDPVAIESFLYHLHAVFEWIPDNVLLTLQLQRKGLRIDGGKRSLLVGMVHPRLLDLVTMLKERLHSRLRIAAVNSLSIGFKESEVENLTACFSIKQADAHQIISLLRLCFDEYGRFKRQVFEGEIDQLAIYSTVVFEMLWCLFKSTADRKGRLDFLNAIQLLLDRLDDAKHAMQFLLDDFLQNPLEIKHMDRNAMVLANILLRTRNKELRIDLNFTPEEVLGVHKGINRQIQQYVAWRLDFDQAHVMNKIATISALLHDPVTCEDKYRRILFDTTFLAALERETFIFLALAGGKIARSLLRKALGRYGVLIQEYLVNRSSNEMLVSDPLVIANQLRIIIRGIGRIGRPKDLDILDRLKEALESFPETEQETRKENLIVTMRNDITQAKKAILNG